MHKYLLLSLKSRNEIYAYSNFLKNNRIPISIINSPQTISSSCTLSIKIDYLFLNKIVNLINKQKPKSFLGLYTLSQQNNTTQTIRLM